MKKIVVDMRTYGDPELSEILQTHKFINAETKNEFEHVLYFEDEDAYRRYPNYGLRSLVKDKIFYRGKHNAVYFAFKYYAPISNKIIDLYKEIGSVTKRWISDIDTSMMTYHRLKIIPGNNRYFDISLDKHMDIISLAYIAQLFYMGSYAMGIFLGPKNLESMNRTSSQFELIKRDANDLECDVSELTLDDFIRKKYHKINYKLSYSNKYNIVCFSFLKNMILYEPNFEVFKKNIDLKILNLYEKVLYKNENSYT